MLHNTSRILRKQTNVLRQKKFLTSSFFKFLSVLRGRRLLSKVSLKRKNTVGDNENKYFHITVKIISRFLLFQDRIWGRKARPKSEISPPPPFPPTARYFQLELRVFFGITGQEEGLSKEERIHIREVIKIALEEFEDEDILKVLKESVELRLKICFAPFPPLRPASKKVSYSNGKHN